MRKRLVFNAPSLKPRRKQLRNRTTKAEKILWSCLKNNGIKYKFIRQYSVEGYVLDFYCPEKRLAIELDGKIHTRPDQQKYDSFRTNLVNAWGIKLIRFQNHQVEDSLTEVLKQIKAKLVLPSYGERSEKRAEGSWKRGVRGVI